MTGATRGAARARCVLALAVAGWLAVAPTAGAWIPEPERAWATVAEANQAAGRARALALDVALVDAEGRVAATGRARFEPAGRARLDLALSDGGSEVHERAGAEYRVTRNGQPVPKPLRLLPPLALLQAGSPMAVADALRAVGGDPAQVDLGMEGTHDCWVLGGRDTGSFEGNSRPSLWVDQETRRAVRIDDGREALYRLGPAQAQGGVRLPSWIEIRAAGWPIWRLEVRTAAPAP